VFTPQPGTGCQTQNPQFTNPTQNDFALLSGSSCIQSGVDGYDLGARFFTEIPESPKLFELIQHESDSSQIHMRWINPDITSHGNVLDTVVSIKIWRNDSLIAEILNNTNQDTMIYSDIIGKPDFYRYQIAVTDTIGKTGRKMYSSEMLLGGAIGGILIWELDRTPISGQEITKALNSIGYDGNVYKTNYSSRYPLETTVQAVFVCLGIYANNYILSDAEGQRLANYLDNGGRLYMEGGDTWQFDMQTVVHPYFDILPISDGGADLFHVAGDTGTAFSNMYFDYAGENSWMDQIETRVNSTRIFFNADLNTGVGVANDAGTYKTIGTSFEFGGLVDGGDPSSKNELLNRILQFFDIIITTGIDPEENQNLIPEQFVVHQNYPNPFNNSTIFQIAVPEAGNLTLHIFDITGKKVFENKISNVTPAVLKVHWNGLTNSDTQIASGIYFYRFNFTNKKGEKFSQIKKLTLLK